MPPVLKIIWASGPWVVSGLLASRLTGALLPLAFLAIARIILDGIADVSRGNPVPPFFWAWVGIEFGLAAFSSALGRFTGFLESLLADRFSRHLSIRIMAHASRLDLASYEDPAFYDILERARVQATDRIAIIQATGTVFQQAATAIGLCVAILAFSPWLLLSFIFVLPAVLGESHFAFAGYALNISQTPLRRKLDYFRLLGASKESAKEMRLFNLSQFFTDTFTDLSNTLYEQNVALSKRRLIAGGLLSLLTTLGYYSAYVYIIWSAVQGRISVGTVAMLGGALSGANTALQNVFSSVSGIADQALFLTDLLEFFATEPRIQIKPNALPAPRPIRDGFRFEGVTFRYPNTKRMVLDGVHFHLSPGEKVALVGENGQGKTTLVKLITRLYDPTAGRILLDGVDLRDYDPASLNREVGVVFQDFMKYDLTAHTNIAVGRLHDLSGDAVEKAARKSLAHDTIARLPNGYHQVLGRRFEGGLDLSGGEWQRLAIARAYLRDAQLLVLDEPTAALDARSEYEVFLQFAQLTAGRMAFLISHRFSTVRMADRILVLEGGNIAEEGSHDQLLSLRGRYSELYELQATSYR